MPDAERAGSRLVRGLSFRETGSTRLIVAKRPSLGVVVEHMRRESCRWLRPLPFDGPPDGLVARKTLPEPELGSDPRRVRDPVLGRVPRGAQVRGEPLV